MRSLYLLLDAAAGKVDTNATKTNAIQAARTMAWREQLADHPALALLIVVAAMAMCMGILFVLYDLFYFGSFARHVWTVFAILEFITSTDQYPRLIWTCLVMYLLHVEPTCRDLFH